MEQKDILQNSDLLNSIRRYSKVYDKQESCGLIISRGLGVEFLECVNLSKNPECSFVIDTKKFIENKVLYVYHSHVNCSANPSKMDILTSNELGVPFLIYSLKCDEFRVYENISV